MVSPYLMMRQRSRVEVVLGLIAKYEAELQQTADFASRVRLKREIQRLQEELELNPV